MRCCIFESKLEQRNNQHNVTGVSSNIESAFASTYHFSFSLVLLNSYNAVFLQYME